MAAKFGAVLAAALTLPAATLSVGPGQPYTRPCAAIAAASSGDTIEIDASVTYKGDVCGWTTNQLTLRGVNGRAHIDAAGSISQGKAIWVITGNDTVVENIEFSGAASPDLNGAGIRQEGRNLTVRNCWFHDNQDGILAGDSASSQILIEYTEFGYNGAGDGFSHNFYINHVARFTMRFCYSHHSIVGHLVKTRAAENYILYNRLSDEADGTGSYEIDVPNGGRTVVIGNIVEQGPRTGNSTILNYLEEGINPANPDNSLFVVNNTFVNDRPNGATFISIAAADTVPAVIRNNIFAGPGTVTTQKSAIMDGNVITQSPGFVNSAAYDYHLRADSPAIDAAVDAGSDLTPQFHYVHLSCDEGRRMANATLDAGAFEWSGAAYDPAAPPACHIVYPPGVVNGADFVTGPVAPGEVAAIFGANLASDAGASVSVNGAPARVFAANADQVVIQVPPDAPNGQAQVVVTTSGIDAISACEIAPVAPAIFQSSLTTAQPSTAADIYFTGYGNVDLTAGPPQVMIGGTSAALLSLDLMPDNTGVAHAQIQVPQLPPGDYKLVVSIAGVASNPVPLPVVSAQ